MKKVDEVEAKARLPELIDAGEPVAITRDGRIVAQLVPVREAVSEVLASIRAME